MLSPVWQPESAVRERASGEDGGLVSFSELTGDVFLVKPLRKVPRFVLRLACLEVSVYMVSINVFVVLFCLPMLYEGETI